MHRPLSPRRALRVAALGALLVGAACTTEFLVEGGDCRQDADCESGEICRPVIGARGDAAVRDDGERVGVCLRRCSADRDCVIARDEICLLDEGGESGVCGRACVTDAHCGDRRMCLFGQCVSEDYVVDAAPPPPDGAAADVGPADGGDTGSDGAPTDGALVDGAPLDADPLLDGAPMDADPLLDGAPMDAEPALDGSPDGGAPDQGAPEDAGPDIAVDAAPDMAPAR